MESSGSQLHATTDITGVTGSAEYTLQLGNKQTRSAPLTHSLQLQLHHQQPGAVACVILIMRLFERDMRGVQIATSGVSTMVTTVGCLLIWRVRGERGEANTGSQRPLHGW